MKNIFKRFAASLLISTSALATEYQTFNATEVDEIQQITRDYLLANPEILLEVSEILQMKQYQEQLAASQANISEYRDDIFNSSGSQVAGNPNGSVTLVSFSDYQCVYCFRLEPVIKQLTEKNPDLRVVTKQFVIFGEASEYAARATLAAHFMNHPNQEKFHHVVMGLPLEESGNAMKSNPRFDTDYKAQILAMAQASGIDPDALVQAMETYQEAIDEEIMMTMALGQAIGVSGTPAIVVGPTQLPAGIRSAEIDIFQPGYVEEQTLQAIIDDIRAKMS